jgi:hypothetical protein
MPGQRSLSLRDIVEVKSQSDHSRRHPEGEDNRTGVALRRFAESIAEGFAKDERRDHRRNIHKRIAIATAIVFEGAVGQSAKREHGGRLVEFFRRAAVFSGEILGDNRRPSRKLSGCSPRQQCRAAGNGGPKKA